MQIHPLMFLVFVIACAATAAGWSYHYAKLVMIPKATTAARKSGVEAMRAEVIRTAKQYVGNPDAMIMAVCEGGPLDGIVFFQSVNADLAVWRRGPEVVATYAMSFRSSPKTGHWVFKHVPHQTR
jgi:hypothetical protein